MNRSYIGMISKFSTFNYKDEEYLLVNYIIKYKNQVI